MSVSISSYRNVLERKLVHHCAPTLAGIKPANLFICRSETVPRFDEYFTDALRICRDKLAPRGVYVEVLARRKTGTLLYVYRADLVEERLAQPKVMSYLAQAGYPTLSLSGCIEHLYQRIQGTDLHSQLTGTCSFPHEIGFFLGYPYTDVIGFIENKGEGFLASGCWKVYAQESDAQACFCRYKECTASYENLFDEGVPLECLASLDQAFPAEEAYGIVV